jgi:hypothetical protein
MQQETIPNNKRSLQQKTMSGNKKPMMQQTSHTLPSKTDFLAFYFVQMVGKFNMLGSDAERASGLDPAVYKRLISIKGGAYQECYQKYIRKEQAAPPKSFWEKHQDSPGRAIEDALTKLTRVVRRVNWVKTGAPWNTTVPIITHEQVPANSTKQDYEKDDDTSYKEVLTSY